MTVETVWIVIEDDSVVRAVFDNQAAANAFVARVGPIVLDAVEFDVHSADLEWIAPTPKKAAKVYG